MLTKNIAKNINEIAKEKNITMYRLAKESNLSISYVWEICKGKRENPSIAVICKIAKALGTTVEELISK
ncbi:helix-turn-helix domain-containing protein [Clostridium perfringens]|uniref:helix-turn-helix domain-containing protein n=1 Tax=Clostridium perfringens TaxID=1502 RepID=UPI0039E8D312